jgi:hypothetical protein
MELDRNGGKTMKEHPIIFNGEMVQAILDGRKTQTRRVMKPQPTDWTEKDGRLWPAKEIDGKCGFLSCPYGKPGDRLWVKETWALLWTEYEPDWIEEDIWDVPHTIEYRADSEALYPGGWPAEEARDNDEAPKWKSARYMPYRASRITLPITDIRIERLQDIDIMGVLAEGASQKTVHSESWFQELWDSINAKRGFPWESNPWVWIIKWPKYEDDSTKDNT